MRRKSLIDVRLLLEKAYFIKESEGLAEGTLYRYRHVHNLFTEFLEKYDYPLDIRGIDADTCRAFINWVYKARPKNENHPFKNVESKAKGVSARYVNDIIKTLKTSFKVLKENGHISKNPFEKIKPIKQPVEVIQILTPDELRRLLKQPDRTRYAPFRDYVLITFMLDTMCRVSEALNLTKYDIDFDAKTVVFHGENVKTRRGRIVPIQARTARLLRELLLEIQDFDTDFIFVTNNGSKYSKNHFRHRLKRYAEQAGIKKGVYPHLLRHSAATIYLENGGNIRYLQSILGHVDLRMTTKYTHLTQKGVKQNHAEFSAINAVVDNLSRPRKIKRSRV